MKNRASTLSLALPSIAHASGGDILSLMWIEFGLLIAILIFIFTSKLAAKYRAIVFSVYALSGLIAYWLTSSLPYSENIILINSANTIIPIITGVATWSWCAKQAKT